MPLTSTTDVLSALGVRTVDPVTIARYDQLRRMAERSIISYCKWPIVAPQLASGAAGDIRYYSGFDYVDLHIMPYTASVYEVRLDNTGNYGQNPGSFGSTTVLVSGQDYALVYEGGASAAGQVGRSGILRRLSNQTIFQFPSDLVFYRGSGGLGYRRPATWPRGFGNIRVTSVWGFSNGVAVSAVSWSSGTATYTTATPHGLWAQQNISISGTSPGGYSGNELQVVAVVDANNFTVNVSPNPGTYVSGGVVDAIPVDIKAAVYTLVGIIRNSTKYGGQVTSESGGDYNYSLQLQRELEFGTVRQYLSPYRSPSGAGAEV
jgi:hypothetical protein